MITDLAYRALIKEVELTPKPGLVDKSNNGSHKDMNIDTFYKSANAIKPFIQKFIKCGNCFDSLRAVGLECEKEMFKATKGVNTHKGMVFSLAVICGALGSVKSVCLKSLQDEIKYICRDLIENDLKNSLHVKTHGEQFYKQTNKAGIREEAANGYPSIFEHALPFYIEHEKKYGEDIALKLTLLLFMSMTEDSTVYARGGIEGLEFIKKEAKQLLHAKNIDSLDEDLYALDKKLIKRNLSAGGSADLLGLTWFLAQF